ncbi:MAG: MiaB/RimO family radical SAM methylthiotransferase [Patescibacteria group bacterium]|nr:MiaB/RimO family radical SAM methylthiotransferase [Patescibacteria group bacterium]
MKYFLQVFGCQMNISDSERVQSVLNSLGYLKTLDESKADLIVVIACAVRQSAVDRVSGRAGYWLKRSKNKHLITLLTGCVLEYDKKRLAKYFDYIFPIKDLKRLPELLKRKPVQPIIKTPAPLDEYFDIKPKYNSTFQALVPISTGCNKVCSYCAVPFTRGREISRDPDIIVREVKDLVRRGYREITLLGQNVNSYGWDFKGVAVNLPQGKVYIQQLNNQGQLKIKKRQVKNPMDFSLLLKTIASLPGNFWIRFITSHPYDLSDKLIETIAKYPKLTPYLHLPVQSGSDKILKAMNRQYTSEKYQKLIDKIRHKIPGATISTDIIVGFCGETKADFQKTCALVKNIKFDMAYIAKYSSRPGTAAANRPDDVPKIVKARREKYLNDLLKKAALSNNQKLVGKNLEVLFEKYKKGFAYGKTSGFKNIRVPSAKDFTGKFKIVKVTKATPWHLSGELVTKKL